MKEPVHVTVQMATVGMTVEVSSLHEVQQVMHHVCSRCKVVGVQVCAIIHPILHAKNILHGSLPSFVCEKKYLSIDLQQRL